MPRRSKPPREAGSKPEITVPQELLDQLVKGPMTQGDFESMFRELKKAVIERAMARVRASPKASPTSAMAPAARR